MKVKMKYTSIYREIMGKKDEEIDFSGETLEDLVEFLCFCYPHIASKLKDPQGGIEPSISFAINGQVNIEGDIKKIKLKENDEVEILYAFSGG